MKRVDNMPTMFPVAFIAACVIFGCVGVANKERPSEVNLVPQEVMSSARIEVHIPENDEPVNVYSDEIPMTPGWQAYTQDCCKRYGVDYSLMLGLMETESSFRFDADSGWAYGVCQIGYINEDWLKDNGIDMRTNMGNIEAGCLILSDFLSRYDTADALICYNCGEYGAQELFDKGIHETDYSRSVMGSAEKWRAKLNDRS